MAVKELELINGIWTLKDNTISDTNKFTFTQARTVGLTTPEYGWTWLNSGSLTSANENTTSGSSLHMIHGASNTDWTPSAQTAPCRYYTIGYNGYLEIIALCYSNGDSDYEQMGIVLFDDAARGTYAKFGVGHTNALVTTGIEGRIGVGGLVQTSITTTERNNGVWLRMRAFDDQIALFYNKTFSSTPPTSWTNLTSDTLSIRTKNIGFGQMLQTVNTAGNLAGGCKWWQWSTTPLYDYNGYPTFQATQ
jgi:hypothetical protein